MPEQMISALGDELRQVEGCNADKLWLHHKSISPPEHLLPFGENASPKHLDPAML